MRLLSKVNKESGISFFMPFMLTLFRNSFILLTLSFSLSCTDLSKLKPEMEQGQKEIKPQFDLSKYKQRKEVLLGKVFCRINPENIIKIYAPGSGDITLHVDKDFSYQKKGFVWAEVNADDIHQETKALAKARKRLEAKQKIFAEMEMPREKIKLEKEFENAKSQLDQASILFESKNSDLIREILPESEALLKLKRSYYERAKKEVALYEKALGNVDNQELNPLAQQLIDAHDEWEERYRKLQLSIERSQLKMPFDGDLFLKISLIKNEEKYRVKSGEKIAEVTDLSRLKVKVQILDPAWLTLDPAKILLRLKIGSGKKINARYLAKEVEFTQQKDQVFYVFEVPKNDIEAAARLMGSSMEGELQFELEEHSTIIPKLDLAIYFPEHNGSTDWLEKVEKIFPNSKLTGEGQTSLAINISSKDK